MQGTNYQVPKKMSEKNTHLWCLMVTFQNPKDNKELLKAVKDFIEKNKNQIYIRLLINNPGLSL